MRGLNKLCGVALFGAVMMVAAQASALNVDNIIIYKGIERTNGVINPNGYVLHVEVNATGMDNGGVFQNMTNGTWFALANDGPNRWIYGNSFASQVALDAAHQSFVNYYFLLNSLNSNPSLPPFTDSVQVGFAVNPPAVFANILNPLHNAVGVPLNPVYNWDNMSGSTKAHALGLEVWDTLADAKVYSDLPEMNTGLTTWQPGPLAPGDYEFNVINMRLTGLGWLQLSTLNGDSFNYAGANAQSNWIDFTTLPEPGTMALVGTAALGLVGWRRRRSMK
jgi:hypothetical protein